MQGLNRQLRVCMFPRDIPFNEGLGIMSDALERTGKVKITNYKYFTSFFARADLFHVHWVDELVVGARWKCIIKIFLFLSFFLFCKMLNRPIVWTVHNVGAHESNYRGLEKLLWSVFLPRVDWAIHLCPASLDAIHRLTATPPPGSVIPHAHYRSVYDPATLPVEPYDHERGPFVFASFGLIRPYKGFENLIEVFHSWKFQEAALHISGSPSFKESEHLVREMAKMSEADPRITLDFRTLTRDEVVKFVSASSVVVLPYNKLLNSGVANVALSLGRPVMGPAVGCILDYYEKLGPKWILMYENELNVEHLRMAYERFRGHHRGTLPDLSWMDADRVAADILSLYQQVINASKRPGCSKNAKQNDIA